ncbi:MAG: MoxR family ATPase [Candidatus Latescibacteria bacterium]|jgi:MoxR-like ATPase|nr:MoxR family ATPase [Candidatus Latescibacterota bacterium]
MQETADIQAINEEVARESAFAERLSAEVGKVIVGQETMVERLMIGLLCSGHVLLEGVPGLAKTLTINTLARAIRASFARIQFTPDLLPADLVGTMIYHQPTGEFVPKKGPLFAQLVLADEVNRAPAKVQSAMLEAMQERQVTIGDQTFPMADPFLVLATQNPIEQEGTYPLPEAQVDRFMLKVVVGYPSRQEERAIVDRMGQLEAPQAEGVVTPEDIIRAREVVDRVYVDGKIRDYVVDLILATRDPAACGLPDLKPLIEYGCSPRGSIYLTRAARAHAFLRRRGYVTPDDVKAVGQDILRHRVIVTYEAEAEEITSEDVVQQVFDHIEVP